MAHRVGVSTREHSVSDSRYAECGGAKWTN